MPTLFPFGFFNINKPSGITSRAVVNQVQKVLPRDTKIGHAGTLDPLARGVLVVATGYATRVVEYVQRLPKQYVAKFLLGRTSPTEDVEGPIEILKNPPVPTLEQLQAAVRERFLGEIEQVPPVYSALKVDGRRAHELAREGEEVELAARTVEVFRCEILAYKYPELQILLECSGGTYVRSLGRDLAESVGTGAVMSALTRTAIGQFHVGVSVEVDSLTRDNWRKHLIPVVEGVADLPRLELSDDDLYVLAKGNARIEAPKGRFKSDEIAGVDKHGRLIAILFKRGEGILGPKRNFAPLIMEADAQGVGLG